MRIGTGLPATMPLWSPKWDSGQVARGVFEVAKAADRLGYAWVSTPEHLIVPPDAAVYKGSWYDALTILSYVAGVTTRVRLLTSVLVVPYRSPVALAKAVATLDALSGGRMILGVGAGHLQSEFEALAVPYDERAERMEEYLALLRALWEREPVTFEGRWYRFRDMNFEPKPAGRLTVWVGGESRRALRRAVDYGDGWFPARIRFEEALRLRPYLEAYREERGVERAIDWIMSPGAWVRAPMVKSPAPAIVESPRYAQLNRSERAGNPAALIEDYARLAEAGVAASGVSFVYQELDELLDSLQWFAEEVLPKVQKEGSDGASARFVR
jgi:probable F420-dependent oxidoreductase